MSEIVDSHCHASNRWYEPVDTLLFQMDRCGVARAVLVQLLGGTNHDAMRDAVARHPDRFAWVGMIDPQAPEWRDAINGAADAGAAGLRMRAAWRSGGDDPLAMWRAVESAGLRVSLAGSTAQFTNNELAEVARALPGLTLVLEHLGGLARPDAGDRETALAAVCELAALPNVLLKFPGLGQLAPRLASPDAVDGPLDLAGIAPMVSRIISAFGAERLMWGSDFPPVAAREGYANALAWSRDFVKRHWRGTEAAIFGDTATQIWFQ